MDGAKDGAGNSGFLLRYTMSLSDVLFIKLKYQFFV